MTRLAKLPQSIPPLALGVVVVLVGHVVECDDECCGAAAGGGGGKGGGED